MLYVDRLGLPGFSRRDLHVLGIAANHATAVLENLSRTGSLDEAHQGLMASPVHRTNIVDATVTHVGVGVACADGEVLVTQLFVRPKPIERAKKKKRRPRKRRG